MSVSALSSSSLDSESTQSSQKYPSTFTLETNAGTSGTRKLQEPDVIASTKPKQKVPASAPVAPPRYKKKTRNLDSLALAVSVTQDGGPTVN